MTLDSDSDDAFLRAWSLDAPHPDSVLGQMPTPEPLDTPGALPFEETMPVHVDDVNLSSIAHRLSAIEHKLELLNGGQYAVMDRLHLIEQSIVWINKYTYNTMEAFRPMLANLQNSPVMRMLRGGN